jgi:DNA-binding NtrC family response regulator
MVGSFFTYILPSRVTLPSRLPVVALIVDQEDRRILAGASSEQTWEVHFAESCEHASAMARRLAAPVILLDRDWSGTEWRGAVESLAALPHRACVILVSGVADANLWQEIVRRDGYDILSKPLRKDDVMRVVKLALTYWGVRAPAPPALAGGRRK